MPPLLDVRGVTLQYKSRDHLVTATYRVGFSVHRADRFILLGPSGCGKSTLLKALRRLHDDMSRAKPTSWGKL